MKVSQTQQPATKVVVLPPPLVKLTRHPLKWLWNKAQLLVTAALLAYVGMLIVVAVYYLLFEVNPTMTSLWHHVISDASLRHNIRDVGEGLLGGLLAQLAIWNHYKRRKPKTRLDELEISWHIPNVKDERHLSFGQLLVSPVLALIYAIPGFFVALFIVFLVHRYQFHTAVPGIKSVAVIPHSSSIWARMRSVWTQNWQKKMMGYGASLFFGRRPAKGVFDDLQLWFAEDFVESKRSVRWWYPPTFQARYNDVAGSGIDATTDHGFWRSLMMWAALVVGFGLAVYGFYVLTFVATT